jgi:iduronate 2-sulfatase
MALHDWRELRGYRDIPDQGPLTAAQEAHLRHGYYAATTYADAQIGKVIAELDRLELGSSTVICLWGDHGWHLGEHGLWGKTTNFELDTRSPLIISVPHQARVGTSSRSLVEFVDVYPTLVDVCGLNQPAHVEGVSLAPVLDDPTTRVKEYALSQFPRPWPVGEKPEYMGYSLRSERYRYTEWRELESGAVGARELYDHDNDPLESVNLAGRREHEGAAEHLRSALRTSPATMRCRKNGRAPG